MRFLPYERTLVWLMSLTSHGSSRCDEHLTSSSGSPSRPPMANMAQLQQGNLPLSASHSYCIYYWFGSLARAYFVNIHHVISFEMFIVVYSASKLLFGVLNPPGNSVWSVDVIKKTYKDWSSYSSPHRHISYKFKRGGTKSWCSDAESWRPWNRRWCWRYVPLVGGHPRHTLWQSPTYPMLSVWSSLL